MSKSNDWCGFVFQLMCSGVLLHIHYMYIIIFTGAMGGSWQILVDYVIKPIL